MFDGDIVSVAETLDKQAEIIRLQGIEYATAFRALDPRLKTIDPTKDHALAFDVGSGPEGVAFKILGFYHAILTNNPSVAYQFFMVHKPSDHEANVITQLRPHFPKDIDISHLGASDWLTRPNISPRLTTMLRIAPGYFSDIAESKAFFQLFIDFYKKLKSPSTIILSALGDMKTSLEVFKYLDNELNKLNKNKLTQHQLYTKPSIPPPLQVLGEQILTIIK